MPPAGTLAGLVAAAALVAWFALMKTCSPGAFTGVPPGHDAAVVLLSGPNRLVIVDLCDRRIVADMRLRSLALDVAVDPSSGCAVTAQCGGVGVAADDAAGVYDVRGGGAMTYVTLARANPGVVACMDGRAYVQHGVYEDGGLFLSVIDPVRRERLATGLAPDGPGTSLVPTRHGLVALGSTADDPQDGPSPRTGDSGGPAVRLACIHPSDLATHAIGPALAGVTSVGTDGRGGLAVFGTSDGAAWFADLSSPEGAVRRLPLCGLARAGRGCLTRDWVAAADTDDPAIAEWSKLAITGRETGRPSAGLRVLGGVAAIAPWGDLILVVARDPYRLIVVDPARARAVWELPLGSGAVLGVDLEVLPGEPSSGGRGESGDGR